MTSDDMAPIPSTHYVTDQRGCDAELSRQCRIGSAVATEFSNPPDVYLGEFRGWASFATTQAVRTRRCAVASLCGHVAHVVGSGAQEQMIRIHARRHVASVADVKAALRNRTAMQFPRDPMGTPFLQFVIRHGTVAGDIGTSPQPATLGFLDATPEPLDRIATERQRSAPCATGTPSAAQFNLRSRAFERFLTNDAREIHARMVTRNTGHKNRLHRQVCAGTVTLVEAQRQMKQWGRP